MKKLINQISIKRPNSILITGYDVRVCNNIIQLENGQYQYDMIIYTKVEYKEVEEQINREKDNKLIELETKNTELNQTVINQNELVNSLTEMVIQTTLPTS